MTDLPHTLASPQLQAFDDEAWVDTATINPAIVLIEATHSYLGVLLAKRATFSRSDTTLEAVRWTRIPQGWRLALIRLLSHLHAARLPDEWLFNEVRLYVLGESECYYAVVTPRGPHLPQPSTTPYPLKMLTEAEYNSLARAFGRELHTAVTQLFATYLERLPGGSSAQPI